jgi:hypothetical protein
MNVSPAASFAPANTSASIDEMPPMPALTITRARPTGGDLVHGSWVDPIPGRTFGAFDDAVHAARENVSGRFDAQVAKLRNGATFSDRRWNGLLRPQPPITSIAVVSAAEGYRLANVGAAIDAYKEREVQFGGGTRLRHCAPATSVVANAASGVQALVGRDVWADLREASADGTRTATLSAFSRS